MNASPGEKFRAALATGRVANLPTVWSNVIVAFHLAITLDLTGSRPLIAAFGGHFDHWLLLFACLSASLLYVGGCVLGDYRDIGFDREHRPGRPLVTGLLSPRGAVVGAVVLLGLGFLLGFAANAAASVLGFDIPFSIVKKGYAALFHPAQLMPLALLAAAIVSYALLHKKSRVFALGNMALCRALLVFFAAALGFPLFDNTLPLPLYWLCAPVVAVALSVGGYTLLLSNVAATESNRDKVRFCRALKAGMLALPLAAVGWMALAAPGSLPLTAGSELESSALSAPVLRGYFIGTALVYGSWVVYAFGALPGDKPAFVSRALAGFCLLDACFAATYSATVPLVCFVLFALALLLQRIAPAT